MPAKSPYNFVPAPDWKNVYKPDWADSITHDLPFSDGESGEIRIEMVAETPVFIRSGRQGKGEIQLFPSMMKDGEKKYYIPGSSVRGMVRSVFEVMSRSMLNPDLVGNDRFSHRSLKGDSYYKEVFKTNEVKAGWLEIDPEGSWVIKPAEYCHIHHDEVDRHFNTGFRRIFREMRYPNKYRRAFGKYEDIVGRGKSLDLRFDIRTEERQGVRKKLAIPRQGGEFTGTLVCTGQAGYRNDANGTGKVHEFVFYDHFDYEYVISDDVVEDFLFIYGDSDPSLKNDWKDWKKRLRENKPVPVFFQTEGDYVLHFGLSQLYKLPYNQSVHDLKPIDGYATGTGKNMSRPWDLARSMFGFSSSDSSLKGRIFFGHALCTEQSTHPEDVTLVLGQPKASYAPHYLKDAADFDYDQPDARLSGFKRYFTRNKAVLEPLGQQNDNQNVTTKFRPFGTGSRFECSIRFHNLRKVEIGALLSALTFHGNGDFVRHQVGGAKPYGFGKVRLEVVRCSGFGQDVDITEYQKAFEEELKSSYGGGGDWFISDAVSAFFAMGSGEVNGIQELTYPTLKEHQKRESTLRQPGLRDRNRIKRYKK